jgi:hypothetical protein
MTTDPKVPAQDVPAEIDEAVLDLVSGGNGAFGGESYSEFNFTFQ